MQAVNHERRGGTGGLVIADEDFSGTRPGSWVGSPTRAFASVHVSGHVVLEPEVPALGLPIRRQEGDIPADPSRLLLEVIKFIVGDGPD